jgi:hypothetical protein
MFDEVVDVTEKPLAYVCMYARAHVFSNCMKNIDPYKYKKKYCSIYRP